ncbi:MAG: cell wall metabolism sensor histidine kinase WalK [Clostridiales bacterium]|jgi:two-component system sensor histidine kinase VicK|nr:cell wall metabolism sensor histidine kinase WalK [Clostridiales bacterium]
MKDKVQNRFSIFHGIMIKLVVLYLALVFIVMIVSGTFISGRIKAQEADKVEPDLRAIAERIDDWILSDLTEGSGAISENTEKVGLTPEVIEDRLRNDYDSPIRGRNDINYAILDAEGNTIASSGDYDFNDSTIISALTGDYKYEPWVRSRDMSAENGEVKITMNFAMPIKNNPAGEMEYVIFLSQDASDILLSLERVTNTIIGAVAIAMVLAVILGVLFSTTLTGPISSLTKIAGEMALGNLEQEIPVKSDDEIGQLTNSFNNMAKSLNKTMSDMISEKGRIEIILNNMTDGVLAYDSENRLLHANYASSEMLEIDDIEKKAFKEVMDILGIDVKSANDFETIEKDDFSLHIGDKYISVNHNTYRDSQDKTGGVVIVLQDVTRHAKLDNMRREFVANVSHEIRTPLTTIKSYTETLLEGALDDRETAVSFLNTINQETDRMTFLATDLLELSRLDNKQVNMQMEEVNLISIIRNSIRQNTVIAKNKNQTIAFNPKELNINITCDPSRINQVLNNVISNAIKYSGVDTKISIGVNTTGKFCKVFIKDEGMGIPKEDLQRIFERFYRVDKARSREMGGTGLGLAIAKEIMDAHGGKISAMSEPGKGTTMILRFVKD